MTPVEQVFNPNTDTQLWYYIPGFNGYEISDQHIVRSMKHYRQYPFGILLGGKSIIENSQIVDILYTLSNNQNQRVKVSGEELWRLAMDNPDKPSSYPRRTFQTDISSRNNFTHKETNNQGEKLITPKFTMKSYKSPIYFV